MKILGIDTSTKVLSVGFSDGKKACEYNLELGNRLSELITVTIARILQSLSLKPKDLDYLACGQGPGSFTGLRVGMATAKGLALCLRKPVVAVPSLDILAANAESFSGTVMPVVDAKRGLVYTAIYSKKPGSLKRITPYMLLSQKEFLARLKPDCLFLGDGAVLYKQNILNSAKGALFADKDNCYPKGHNIVRLAEKMIAAGKISDSFKVRPVYLYPKDCQIRK